MHILNTSGQKEMRRTRHVNDDANLLRIVYRQPHIESQQQLMIE